MNPFLEASCTNRHGKYPFNRLPFLPTAGWVVSDGGMEAVHARRKTIAIGRALELSFLEDSFLTDRNGSRHFSQFEIRVRYVFPRARLAPLMVVHGLVRLGHQLAN